MRYDVIMVKESNWFVKTAGWVGRMMIRVVIILIASFMLHSCIEAQSIPEPFNGESQMDPSNPILDPIVEKGEELGDWLNEKFG